MSASGSEAKGAFLAGKVFAFGGKREKLDAKAAEELLQPLFAAIEAKDSARFSTLRFGGKSFNLEAAGVVAKVLSQIKGVRTLDLSDIIAGQETGEARQSLELLSKAAAGMDIVELRMDENALGANGIRLSEAVLKGNKSLEALTFNDCGLESKACTYLSEFILSKGKPTKIKKIQMFNNCLTSAGAVALAPLIENSPSLRDVRISTTRISSDGGAKLAAALTSCHQLESLDLTDNNLGAEAGKIIMDKVFDSQPNIRVLRIGDSGLGREQYLGIIKRLTEAKADLQVIDLSYADLEDEDVPTLGALLRQSSSLRVLNLEGNGWEADGATKVAAVLRESKVPLEELSFNNNQLNASVVPAIVELLAAKTSIKKLNLDANFISAKGVTVIRSALRESGREDCLCPMEENDDEEEDGNDAITDLVAKFGKLSTN